MNEDERSRFAHRNGVTDTDVEDAIRAGAIQAIDRAERADAIQAGAAILLRAAARTLPLDNLIHNLQGG